MTLISCTDTDVHYSDANTIDTCSADVIFLGSNIITMDPYRIADESGEKLNSISAVAIRADKIIYIGQQAQALELKDSHTRVVKLGTAALLPGLIDTHGHFTGTARFINFANLSSPPVGTVTNIDGLVTILKNTIKQNNIKPGDWVIGYGYDDSLLEEQRHPNLDDLNRVSTTHPISIIHVSNHFASLNSAALALIGISAASIDPHGGKIRRYKDSQKPNGVLEETAAYRAFLPIAQIPEELFQVALRQTALYYASNGITTAQDGGMVADDIAQLKKISSTKPFPIDIHLYQIVNTQFGSLGDTLKIDTNYHGGVKLSGAKFILDGSPQGRTAWVTKPYEKISESDPGNYIAYGTIDAEFYNDAIAKLMSRGVQVIAHANGDAAIDLMLAGVASAAEKNLGANVDHRSVIIHAQLMREDQLDEAKRLGIIPSFFSAHPYFWGDWHEINFGIKRASQISPTRWAADRGIKFTLHNDAPVVPPNMMRLLWVSVNRMTRSGKILGPEQRLTTYEALRAITINAAHQYFEEDNKGSITVGKQADLVILDRNPLTTVNTALKDIQVLETFARGQSVFVRD